MAKTHPRQWSMEKMRDEGFLTGATEYFNPHTNTRKDLFGFIDFIAIGGPEIFGKQIIGIQCCSRSGLASHRRKLVEQCYKEALAWITSGGSIELHGWDRTEVPCTSKKGTKTRKRLKREVIDTAELVRLKAYYEAKKPPALTAEGSPF